MKESGWGRIINFTPHPDRLTAGLGEQWELLDVGIKPCPACRMTHGAIDAALLLRIHLGTGLPADTTLTVTLNPVDDTIVGGGAANKIEPRNTVEAQFSVRFQVAAADPQSIEIPAAVKYVNGQSI
jgi:2-methylcitrate dehydratase PrpD